MKAVNLREDIENCSWYKEPLDRCACSGNMECSYCLMILEAEANEETEQSKLTPQAQAYAIWAKYGHSEAVMVGILTQLLTNTKSRMGEILQ